MRLGHVDAGIEVMVAVRYPTLQPSARAEGQRTWSESESPPARVKRLLFGRWQTGIRSGVRRLRRPGERVRARVSDKNCRKFCEEKTPEIRDEVAPGYEAASRRRSGARTRRGRLQKGTFS